MTAESFWNQREQAQKLVDEGTRLRKRIDPLLSAEKEVEDFRVMVELAESEPVAQQPPYLQELERDLARLGRNLEALELKVFLNGPHDARNAIFSIQAGAGGTEAQDWAEMLSRMYGRWFDARGWKWEVTDALQGDSAGLKRAARRERRLRGGLCGGGQRRIQRGRRKILRQPPGVFAGVIVLYGRNASAQDAEIPPTRLGHINTSSVQPGSAAQLSTRPNTNSGMAALP